MMRGVPLLPRCRPLVGHLPYFASDDTAQAFTDMAATGLPIAEVRIPFDEPTVVTHDPDLVQKLLRSQGSFPVRNGPGPWGEVFARNGMPAGLTYATGKHWRAMRRPLDLTVGQMSTVAPFFDAIADAAVQWTDFVAARAAPHVDTMGPRAFSDSAALFAISAMLPVLTGFRAQVFDTEAADGRAVAVAAASSTKGRPFTIEVPHSELRTLKRSIADIFEATAAVSAQPWSRFMWTREYRRMDSAWRDCFRVANLFVEPVLRHWEAHGEFPPGVGEASILPRVVKSWQAGELSRADVVGVPVQALIAAIDTTAQTFEFLVYNLLRNPDALARCVAEIAESSCANAAVPTYECVMQELPWMRACLRESMRITPTVPVHLRVLTRDFTHGDVFLPEGTRVFINYRAMALDPAHVQGPSPPAVFDPRRFLVARTGCPHAASASGSQQLPDEQGCPYRTHPFSAKVPFGAGPRRCPGNGIAQVQILTGLFALLRRFDLSAAADMPHEPALAMSSLLHPKEPLDQHFRFAERRQVAAAACTATTTTTTTTTPAEPTPAPCPSLPIAAAAASTTGTSASTSTTSCPGRHASPCPHHRPRDSQHQHAAPAPLTTLATPRGHRKTAKQAHFHPRPASSSPPSDATTAADAAPRKPAAAAVSVARTPLFAPFGRERPAVAAE